MKTSIKFTLKLGAGYVDVVNRLVKVADKEYRIQSKVFRVLLYLSEHSNKIVTREELINEIWEGNHLVGDRALSNAIYQIRKVFSKQSDQIPPIETIPQKGYKLLLPVTKIDSIGKINLLKLPKLNIKGVFLIFLLTVFFFFITICFIAYERSLLEQEYLMKCTNSGHIIKDIGKKFKEKIIDYQRTSLSDM